MRHFNPGKSTEPSAGTGKTMERSPSSRSPMSLIGNRATASLFQERIGPPGDAFEQEADRAAQAVVSGRTGPQLSFGAGGIQRKCATCEQEEEAKIRRAPKNGGDMESTAEQAPAKEEAEPSATESAPAESAPEQPAAQQERPETAPSALIVEDEAEMVAGQMHKSEFLSQLRVAVCATADEGMAGTGRDSQGCPFIDYWIGYYEGQSASHIERALQRYAPDAAGASTAREYIGVAAARVRRSVDIWARTGEITGVPEDLPGAGAAGVLSSFGGLFFKARPGGPRSADPASVRDQLGSGRPLSGGVRSRMESAFGSSFANVRLHTDSKASQLSGQLNARAFTVGQHVAFGAGEYKPGSIAGDALIAHELAHVVQQGGATESGPIGKSPESTGPIEQDADRAAVGAVASLWGGVKGAVANAGPALRSGLQLSRCPKKGGTEQLEVKVRPVRVANDDGSAPTTLPSFDAARRIWNKCCISIVVGAEKIVKKTAYKAVDMVTNNGVTAEEASLFAEPDAAGDGIPVFIPENFEEGGVVSKKPWGGGVTHGIGSADPKVVLVEGVDPTVVGHELGHAMGRATHGPAGTVMQPSGAHNKPVDEKVNADICKEVRAFSGASTTGKTDCQMDT